jgi:serine/threonine-protein kinase
MLADTVGAGPPQGGPERSYAPGETIADRYELVRLAGVGGVGQVWIARSQTLHNEVALKLFVRGGPDDGAERLLREARAAAAIEHPAIVRVFDYGETSRGDPFLVMELLKGESLEELLRRVGPLQAAQALKLLLPILDGLVVAHAKKIIHRDLKPSNLFVSVDEAQRMQPKLIDFGLARHQRGGQRVTQQGVLVGTPAYMSPEQIRDEPLDARSDVWSLTVVLHELVTGRLPFDDEEQYAMFRSILEREPAPLPIAGDVDEGIVAIVKKGLAKEREARFATAHELGVACARWLVAHGHDEDVTGASLEKTWLKPRKVSSLAPPTPGLAFMPVGMIAPMVVPSASSADVAQPLAPTIVAPASALPTPSPGPPSVEVPAFRPRRWPLVAAPMVLVAFGAAAFFAWGANEERPAVTPAARPSAAAPSTSSSHGHAPAAPKPTARPAARPTGTHR